MEDKIFVLVIQILEIIDLHGLLIIPAAFLDLCNQCRHGLTKIDHHIGHLHLRFHQVKQFHEGLIVPLTEVTSLVVIAHEDVYTLKNRAVLHNRMGGFLNGQHIFEALFEEIGLQAECPSINISVVVFEIRIKAHAFKARLPSVVLR